LTKKIKTSSAKQKSAAELPFLAGRTKYHHGWYVFVQLRRPAQRRRLLKRHRSYVCVITVLISNWYQYKCVFSHVYCCYFSF